MSRTGSLFYHRCECWHFMLFRLKNIVSWALNLNNDLIASRESKEEVNCHVPRPELFFYDLFPVSLSCFVVDQLVQMANVAGRLEVVTFSRFKHLLLK